MDDFDDGRDPPNIVIPRHRVDKAKALVNKHYRNAGEYGVLEILTRLQWPNAASFSERGSLAIRDIDDDLQVVAFAAALVAYVEAKGRL